MLGRGRYQVTPPTRVCCHQSSSRIFSFAIPQAMRRPHPEGRDEVADLLLQRQYGPVIEMVVVIMGEDHPLDGRQRFGVMGG